MRDDSSRDNVWVLMGGIETGIWLPGSIIDNEGFGRTNSGKGSIRWLAIIVWKGKILSWNVTSLDENIYFETTS